MMMMMMMMMMIIIIIIIMFEVPVPKLFVAYSKEPEVF